MPDGALAAVFLRPVLALIRFPVWPLQAAGYSLGKRVRALSGTMVCHPPTSIAVVLWAEEGLKSFFG